jgi:RNA polymerase sigma-70 factor (ECF subfamily)
MSQPQSASDQITEAWRRHRPYLVNLAYQMLGDVGDAEDVAQEAFLRLSRADANEIEDIRAWLTVVAGRLCLDQVRSARARYERPGELGAEAAALNQSRRLDPADRVTLDDEVRLALLVVLERLTPAERVAFVLHDIFQTPFDVIASTVGRPAAACRQLASRARRKIAEFRDAGQVGFEPAGHRALTRRFIAACANGDLEELVAVLDPNVSGEVDARRGVVVVGRDRVARNVLRFWSDPNIELVTHPGAREPLVLAFVERKLVGVIALTIEDAKISKIHIHVDESALEPVRAQLG